MNNNIVFLPPPPPTPPSSKHTATHTCERAHSCAQKECNWKLKREGGGGGGEKKKTRFEITSCTAVCLDDCILFSFCECKQVYAFF